MRIPTIKEKLGNAAEKLTNIGRNENENGTTTETNFQKALESTDTEFLTKYEDECPVLAKFASLIGTSSQKTNAFPKRSESFAENISKKYNDMMFPKTETSVQPQVAETATPIPTPVKVTKNRTDLLRNDEIQVPPSNLTPLEQGITTSQTDVPNAKTPPAPTEGEAATTPEPAAVSRNDTGNSTIEALAKADTAALIEQTEQAAKDKMAAQTPPATSMAGTAAPAGTPPTQVATTTQPPKIELYKESNFVRLNTKKQTISEGQDLLNAVFHYGKQLGMLSHTKEYEAVRPNGKITEKDRALIDLYAKEADNPTLKGVDYDNPELIQSLKETLADLKIQVENRNRS